MLVCFPSSEASDARVGQTGLKQISTKKSPRDLFLKWDRSWVEERPEKEAKDVPMHRVRAVFTLHEESGRRIQSAAEEIELPQKFLELAQDARGQKTDSVPDAPDDLMESLSGWLDLSMGFNWVVLGVEKLGPELLSVSDVLSEIGMRWLGTEPTRRFRTRENFAGPRSSQRSLFSLHCSKGLDLRAIHESGSLVTVKERLARKLGLNLPKISYVEDRSLSQTEYQWKLRQSSLGGGSFRAGMRLLLAPSAVLQDVRGIEATYLGNVGRWVEADQNLPDGYPCLSSSEVVAGELYHLCLRYPHELVTRQDVVERLQELKSEAPELSRELEQSGVAVGFLRDVLRKLVREHVPLHDLVTVVETVIDRCSESLSAEEMTEFCRVRLGGAIVEELLDREGKLHCVELSADAVEECPTGDELRMSLKELGFPPALLVPAEARLKMARRVEKAELPLRVLKPAEIPPWIKTSIVRLDSSKDRH